MIRCRNCDLLYKIKLRDLNFTSIIYCPECHYQIDLSKLMVMRIVGGFHIGLQYLVLSLLSYKMSNITKFSLTLCLLILLPIILFLGSLIYRELVYLILSKFSK